MTDGMTIQVFTGVDRPVVVKTATTASARAAIEREAVRLQRARHPGVVEVLSVSTDRLEIAWVGAHTLDTARLAVPAAAGVLAAVAETIADLHGLGIIHGRLDPSHVVLAGDGRPVVCGMVGPDPTDSTIGPADDVAAIGRLIDHLLGPDAEPEPIPDRRWGRRNWTGYHRRTLQLLADRASHDDPARRPTARAVANAIVEAVPEARLVPATEGRAPTPDPAEHPLGPTAYPAPLSPESIVDHGPPPTSTRWTDDEALSSPPAAPTTGDSAPGRTVDPDPNEIDGAEIGRERPAATKPEPEPTPQDDAAVEAEPDPVRAAPFLPHPHDAGSAPSPDDAASADRVLGMRVEDPPAPTGRVEPPAPPGRAVPAARRPPLLVVGAAALTIAVIGVSRLGHAPPPPTLSTPPDAGQPDDRSATREDAPTAADRMTPSPPPSSTPPSTPPDQTAPGADATGNRVVQAGVTYSIGEPGDRVAVADWDCDGTPTPGVVRPASGEVFLFDGWATADQPLVNRPAVVVPGADSLRAPAPEGGCTPVLALRDGSSMILSASETGEGTGTTWSVGAGGGR